jgi:hypothetical protein
VSDRSAINDRLGDRSRVDLLDRDVQAGLGAGDEVDDHLLQIVGGPELSRPNKSWIFPPAKLAMNEL